MSALLQSLIYTAQRAGGAIMAIHGTDFSVRDKADASPVTAADEAAEKIILADLALIAPDVPVVAEESVAAGRVPVIAERFFLVDPLDGTKEFVSHRDEFTVNVALIEDGEPVLGVVYAPARRELFWGDVRAGKAGHIDADPDGTMPSMGNGIAARAPPAQGLTAVASRSHRTPETDAFLANYPVAEFRSIGSSLKFCLVAMGEADIYPRLGTTMEWDTAAGHAVLAAAGGYVTGLAGELFRYAKPGFRNGNFVARGRK
ncbi:MAG TPA: 3'(2'),5'-bisphosphate nucleotidase CysQ [Steroidobacteraceae bacterium]|jgi:3'(2'), 5'-bisphosphate nucleotidase|nr:3'(2'),5'-bisphosphate nucleotidase CysQ [Steroidobacteraceae bacterium]